MKNSNNSKVIVITGGSSGIGLATAECLANKGNIVYSLSRHENVKNNIKHLTCDVTKEEQIKNAIDKIISEQDHIDILICAAGFGISGVTESTPLDIAKKQFDVNLWGTVSIVSYVLPQMRKQGYGRIIGISSLASIFPIPFQSFYSASKAAIDSYFFALANEVKPYGISICCVRPGDTATGFTAAREKTSNNYIEYNERVEKSVSKMEKDEQSGMSAQSVGKLIAKVALKKKCKPYIIPGFSNNLLGFLCKFLPSSLVQKIVGIMYSK